MTLLVKDNDLELGWKTNDTVIVPKAAELGVMEVVLIVSQLTTIMLALERVTFN